MWTEANESLTKLTQEQYPGECILNYTVYDEDDIEIAFNIASNGQSSSLPKFGTHAGLYRHIKFFEQKISSKKTLSALLRDESIHVSTYNMNLDIQGVELRSIKGLGYLLVNIKYIYTEVNNEQIDEDNELMIYLDTYLLTNGFSRKETYIINGKWLDALYTR